MHKLNKLTSSHQEVFRELPAAVKQDLFTNDFDSWDDVRETLKCDDTMLERIMKLVDTDNPVQRAVNADMQFAPMIGNQDRLDESITASSIGIKIKRPRKGKRASLKTATFPVEILPINRLKKSCGKTSVSATPLRAVDSSSFVRHMQWDMPPAMQHTTCNAACTA